MPQRKNPSRSKRAVPQRGTALATVLRNIKIAQDRFAGLTAEYVAEKHKVSVSTVNAVMADWRAYISIGSQEDMKEWIEEQLARYDVLYGKLAQIVESGDSDSDKIAGIARQMQSIKEGVALRQSTGILPNDLGDIRVHMDFVLIGRRLSEAMDAADIPLSLQERLIDIVAGEVNSGAASAD